MVNYLKYKFVSTRKPHICFGCGRKFEAGSQMISAAYNDGGNLESYYLCQTCERITSRMRHDDEFGYGDLRTEALEMENQ